MQIGAGPVEQADDRGVDVPHLVGSRGSKAYLGLRRMHAEPGAPPAVLPHEVVPGRRGGPDLPEPLREDGERAGRDMTVLRRGHHGLDRPDLGWRQSMRRRARTGRLIVERTRGLPPAPGMEPARRQPEELQERPQRHARAGLIDGAQDPPLGASVGQSLARQRESRGLQQGQHEAEQRRELLDASPQLQDLLPEFRLREVRHIQTDHDRRHRAEPPTRGRARDAEIRGDGHVAGAADEVPQPMVIAPLRAGRGRHGDDHRPFAHAAQLPEDDAGRPPREPDRLRDDNSRGKVQNVRGDSSATKPTVVVQHVHLSDGGQAVIAGQVTKQGGSGTGGQSRNEGSTP